MTHGNPALLHWKRPDRASNVVRFRLQFQLRLQAPLLEQPLVLIDGVRVSRGVDALAGIPAFHVKEVEVKPHRRLDLATKRCEMYPGMTVTTRRMFGRNEKLHYGCQNVHLQEETMSAWERYARVFDAERINLRILRPLAAALSLAACDVADAPLQPDAVMAENAASAVVGPNASIEQQLAAVRRLVAPYHSFDQGQSAGYTVPILPCRENPPIGAMGEHYLNPAYVDGVVDALQPEVLVYEPQKNGGRRFVAVEYIIPFAILPPTAAPPTLFGQEFLLNFGDQVWMQHVWLGRHNHDGMFATWNPQVSCQFAEATE